jgi:hypothetical protein
LREGLAVGATTKGLDRRYWREIALVLTGKAIGLLLLYLLFFAAPPAVPPLGDHVFSQETHP